MLSNLNHENYQTIRSNVIDMVLATELGKHFEHVNKFISSTRVADEAVLDGSGRSPRQLQGWTFCRAFFRNNSKNVENSNGTYIADL